MVGLRGVGKTVLLNRLRRDADGRGFVTIFVEAPEGRSLPGLLAAPLRASLMRMGRRAIVGDAVQRALRALVGFIDSMRITYQDIELRMSLASQPGLADSGDLEHDLGDLLTAAGEAARADGMQPKLSIF